jgi:hypothetical protein
MRFVLEHLAETIQQRREALEAAQEAELNAGPWDGPTGVSDDLIDPTLRSDEGDAQNGRQHESWAAAGSRRQTQGETSTQRQTRVARIVEEACNAYGLRGSKRKEVKDFSAVSIPSPGLSQMPLK